MHKLNIECNYEKWLWKWNASRLNRWEEEHLLLEDTFGFEGTFEYALSIL